MPYNDNFSEERTNVSAHFCQLKCASRNSIRIVKYSQLEFSVNFRKLCGNTLIPIHSFRMDPRPFCDKQKTMDFCSEFCVVLSKFVEKNCWIITHLSEYKRISWFLKFSIYCAPFKMYSICTPSTNSTFSLSLSLSHREWMLSLNVKFSLYYVLVFRRLWTIPIFCPSSLFYSYSAQWILVTRIFCGISNKQWIILHRQTFFCTETVERLSFFHSVTKNMYTYWLSSVRDDQSSVNNMQRKNAKLTLFWYTASNVDVNEREQKRMKRASGVSVTADRLYKQTITNQQRICVHKLSSLFTGWHQTTNTCISIYQYMQVIESCTLIARATFSERLCQTMRCFNIRCIFVVE